LICISIPIPLAATNLAVFSIKECSSAVSGYNTKLNIAMVKFNGR
jgi:hypothetical protein